MKRISFLLSIIIITVSFIFSSGCENSTEPEEQTPADSTDGPVVYKPDIYLYPTETCSLSVKLEFPLGGKIIESEPLYKDGWFVKVEPYGKINDKYNYLYYEATCPEVYQYDSGWVVRSDSLLEFFSKNLSNVGFNETERTDFSEYWIPRLVDYDYYIIYPQYSDIIEKIIKLKISITPDNVLRLFYVIKGTDNNKEELSAPSAIPNFYRNGFVVTEWGVILK